MTDNATPEMIAAADQRITHANQFIDKLVEHHTKLLRCSDRTVATMELAVALDMFIESKPALADALAAALSRLVDKECDM